MKAIRLHAFGDPPDLRLENLPEPEPAPGEIRIRIASAGVNPIDWKTCRGGGARPFIGELPWIPGWECAGVVDAVGEGVDAFCRGDRVLGFLNFPAPGNCYAEQVCAPADQCALVPPPVGLVEAGGLPLAGLTAAQALLDAGGLVSGQRVLILAAAGGVGHLAVQIAAAQEAEVHGTSSSGRHEWLQSLGCSRCYDYHQPLPKDAGPFDLILDAVGGDAAIAAIPLLKPEGIMVTLPSVTAEAVVQAAADQGRRATGFRVQPDARRLAMLAAMKAEGCLELEIADVLPLREVSHAHELSASGHVRGKLLLTP